MNNDRPPIMDELARCRGWIEDALEYSGGTHDYQDIVDGILDGKMQLWAGESGCGVTEINVYPKKKILHVFLLGGELNQILDFEESMAEFARMNGCSAMTGAGRPGWDRVMKSTDHGWKRLFVVIERPV